MPAQSSGAAPARSRFAGHLQHEALGRPRPGWSSRRRSASSGPSRCRCRSRAAPFSQNCSRSSSQASQARHESTMQPTPARSPTLNFVTLAPTLRHPAHDLVAGHHREDGAAPLVAGLVDVGVADAAVEDVDLHVVRAHLAAVELERRQRGGLGEGGVAPGLGHLLLPVGGFGSGETNASRPGVHGGNVRRTVARGGPRPPAALALAVAVSRRRGPARPRTGGCSRDRSRA